jgi:hypothetical protein
VCRFRIPRHATPHRPKTDGLGASVTKNGRRSRYHSWAERRRVNLRSSIQRRGSLATISRAIQCSNNRADTRPGCGAPPARRSGHTVLPEKGNRPRTGNRSATHGTSSARGCGRFSSALRNRDTAAKSAFARATLSPFKSSPLATRRVELSDAVLGLCQSCAGEIRHQGKTGGGSRLSSSITQKL